MKKEVKVEVTYTPGYEKRYTAACIEVLKKRKARKEAARQEEQIRREGGQANVG